MLSFFFVNFYCLLMHLIRPECVDSGNGSKKLSVLVGRSLSLIYLLRISRKINFCSPFDVSNFFPLFFLGLAMAMSAVASLNISSLISLGFFICFACFIKTHSSLKRSARVVYFFFLRVLSRLDRNRNGVERFA